MFKVFHTTSLTKGDDLEKQMNEWLSKMTSSVEVKHVQPVFGSPTTGGTILMVIVYYTTRSGSAPR